MANRRTRLQIIQEELRLGRLVQLNTDRDDKDSNVEYWKSELDKEMKAQADG